MDFANADEALAYCEKHDVPLGPLTPAQGRGLTPDQSWARIVALKASDLTDVRGSLLAGMIEAIEENDAIQVLAEGA